MVSYKKQLSNQGSKFALGASFLNALVGVLSISSFAAGLHASQVAFYKCLAAFIVLSCLVYANKESRAGVKALTKYIPHLAILAFFGFFCLYFFETKAYSHNSIALVVFAMLASSTVATFACSYFFALIGVEIKKIICVLFALAGLISLAAEYPIDLNIGLLYASLAGIGYGMFLVLNNQFKLPVHGIPLLWWLTLFGTLYLACPFFMNSPQLPPLSVIPNILLLGIGPTIGGFYCTTKALSLINATEVQLFELAEPIIAVFLAFIFYQQAFTRYEFAGAFFILAAIAINMSHVFKRKK